MSPAPESGGKKRPRRAPEILAVAFRLENRDLVTSEQRRRLPVP